MENGKSMDSLDVAVRSGSSGTLGNRTIRSGVDLGVVVASAIHMSDAQLELSAIPAERRGIFSVPDHVGIFPSREKSTSLGLYTRFIKLIEPWLFRLRAYFNQPVLDQFMRIEMTLGRLEDVLERVSGNLHSRNEMASDIYGHLENVDANSLKIDALITQMDILTTTVAQLRFGEDDRELSLRNRLDAFDKRFGNISELLVKAESEAARSETYALASARRVAVPSGTEQMLVRTEVGYVLCSQSDSALLANLLEAGELEPGVRQLIQRALKPGDVFVDVGANIGMHAIAAGRAVGPGGKVIAFEPYAPTVRLLEQSLFLNGLSELVELHPVAVADRTGVQSLHLGRTSGHHSLYPLDSERGDALVDVPVVRLDDIVAPDIYVKLIKIDVEGAEGAVVRGAERLLTTRQAEGLIVEFGYSHLIRVGIDPEEWLRMFEQFGFEFRVIDAQTGELHQMLRRDLFSSDSVNLLFARPDASLWGNLNVR